MSDAAADEIDDARIDDELRRALDEVVGPLLRRDGAGLTFVRHAGPVVELRAEGTLRGCPGRQWTLKDVVLPTLKRVLPTLEDVRLV